MIFAPLIILLSALMPYLPGGLRLEHLVVPGLAAWAVLRSSRVHPASLWIVGGLTLGVAATALFSLGSYQTGIYAEPTSQFVRLLMPALIMMAFPFVLSDHKDATLQVANLLVVIAAGTAVFTALSMVWQPLKDLMPIWVRSESGSVWLNAQDIGRYTGIFNQPIEAGIFYSVALIGAIHALRFGTSNKFVILGALVAILFGGGITLSKNFIVLGVASAVAYAWIIRLIPRAAALVLIIPIMVVIPFATERLNVNYFESLMNLYYDRGILAALSAGRFGTGEGTVSILFYSLLSTRDWMTGRGLGSFSPLDNGFLEYFYQGGVIALLGYLVALTAFLWIGWRHRKSRDGMLMLILTVYISVASLGGPVLTANRANISLLLLMSACIVGIRTTARTATRRNAMPVPRAVAQ